MNFVEFVEDLTRELQENKDWGERELSFNTIDEEGLKLMSIDHTDYDPDIVCIYVGFPDGSPKQKMTFAEFSKMCMKSLEDNKVWGEKEVRFIAVGRGDLEYLSIYDSDDRKSVYIDIGTEEDSDEHSNRVLGQAHSTVEETAKVLYIICFVPEGEDNEMGILLGFLPYEYIPEGSVIRDAIYSSSESVQTGEDGVTGVYQDKKLAEEHLRLEKKWRESDEVWMTTITTPVVAPSEKKEH